MSGTDGHGTPRVFGETEAALASDRAGRSIAALSIASTALVAGMVWLVSASVPTYQHTDVVRWADSAAYALARVPGETRPLLLVEARLGGRARSVSVGTPAEVRFATDSGRSVTVDAEVVQGPAASAVVLRITDPSFGFDPSTAPVSARVVVARASPLARLVSNAIP